MSVDASPGLAEKNEPISEPLAAETATDSSGTEDLDVASTAERSVEKVVTTEAANAEQVAASTGQNADGVQNLSERVEQLAGLLEEANDLSRERERIIDRLHQENQQLRAGEIWQAVAPVFRDLIRLYDDLRQTTKSYEARADAEVHEISGDFRSFGEAVEDVLYRHGVERYEDPEGSPFSSKEHKALGVVPTETEHLDRAIARVVRPGFRTDTKIIRILEAEVFRFTPAAASDEAIDLKAEPAVNAEQLTEEKGQ